MQPSGYKTATKAVHIKYPDQVGSRCSNKLRPGLVCLEVVLLCAGGSADILWFMKVVVPLDRVEERLLRKSLKTNLL